MGPFLYFDCYHFFTKWKKSKTLKKVDIEDLISFIEENILSHFVVPEKFIIDNRTILLDQILLNFVKSFKSLWGSLQITTHKEMDEQNLQIKHSFRSLGRQY